MLICLHHTDIWGMKLHQHVCKKQILKFNYYSEEVNSTVKCNYKLLVFSPKPLNHKTTQYSIFYLSLSHQIECAGKCQSASPIKPIFLLCAFFHATTDIPDQLLLRLLCQCINHLHMSSKKIFSSIIPINRISN